MSELVSILVPACNAERWVGRAIGSALAQSWDRKEVIVVDDGSTDHTLQIANGFASQRVRVISQPNAGAAAARNTALRAAQGSYIQFLDADDVLHPDKLARQLRHADDGHRSRTLLTSAWGKFFVHEARAVFAPDSLWQDLSPVEWIVTKFTDNKFMFPASWLVSRRLADEAGPWNEQLSLDDDGEYLCRVVAASRCVHFVRDATCYYRVGNGSSLSSQKSERALRSGYLSIRLCIDHLLALEHSERTRRACVRLLQDNFAHFYPEMPDLVEQCRSLSLALGGDELTVPHERPHFKLFRRVFGWRRAKLLRGRLNDARLQVRRTIDRLPPFEAQAS